MATTPDENDLGLGEPSNTRSNMSLLQVAWQRKSLVILGIMVGLVLGLLYYAQKAPVYSSTAQLLVVKKTPMDQIDLMPRGSDGRSQYMDDYMGTQQVLVRSPVVIQKSLKDPRMKGLASFAELEEADMIYTIRDALVVSRDMKEVSGGTPNNILTLSFRGPVADECPKVLNAVIDSYTGYLNDVYTNVSHKTVELIMQAHKTLNETLETRRKEHQLFREQTPTLLLRSQTGANMYVDRLARIEVRRAELKVNLTELQEQLATVERTYKEFGKATTLQTIASIGLKMPILEGSASLDKELVLLRVRREELAMGLGAKHPDVIRIDKQIELIRGMYGKAAGLLGDGGAGPVPNTGSAGGQSPVQEADTVQVIIQSLKAEMATKQTILTSLNELFTREQQDARELTNFEVREQHMLDAINQAKKMFDTIMTRVQEMELSKNAGGYEAKPIHPPVIGRKIAPDPLKVFPLGALIGLVAGIGLAYLAELSDKSFRTPAEIRRRLGLPVIGHVPFFGPDDKAAAAMAAGTVGVEPMIISHYQSNSIASEAYRAVRTALYFNTQGVGHQVIQVTSPNVSDGKSTLAANLAVSIAQSGKRTIIIDADCRKPRVHKIFGVPAETGLASVIAGTADLESSVQQSAVPNLSVLPCGPRPANPAELLTSPRFKELLDIIRSKYDFVIVDTPPLLVVTDPCVVAPRVDGVILTIRVTKNGRPYAERAKEILASLGANVIGVVVNGFGGQAGGRYGYEHYNYGYGYGYGYTYSYGYTDDEQAKSYYRDPAEPEVADKKKK